MPVKLSLQCDSPGQSKPRLQTSSHPFPGPYRRQLSARISDMERLE
jgi:hypothetical protein